MTRVKRGSIAKKRRKKIMKISEGFRGSQSKLFRTTNQRAIKALKYSYFDRRKKKRILKNIWIRRINAASRNFQISYNKFVNKLKSEKIALNKKVLSEIILKDKLTFEKLIN